MTRRAHEARVAGARVVILGTVPGLLSEGKVVENHFQRVDPRAVGVGVSPEDLQGLRTHLDDGGGDVDAPEDDAYVRLLARFGPVGLPPADLVAAIQAARDSERPVVALDLPEEDYTDTYTEQVSTWQLWRYSRMLKKLGKRPPAADSAAAFNRAWDRRLRRVKGLDAVERLREQHMASRIRELAREHDRVLAVVEASKVDGVMAALAGDGE